jgi:hypothetical protein
MSHRARPILAFACIMNGKSSKKNLDKFIAERRAGIIYTYKFDEAIDPIRTDVNDYISRRAFRGRE